MAYTVKVFVHLSIILLLFGHSVARRNRRLEEENQRTVLPWSVYLTKVAPVGAASAWDIGLSQWSLEYVTVALYTMTKTTSILFIMILGIFFKLERKHWSQVSLANKCQLLWLTLSHDFRW